MQSDHHLALPATAAAWRFRVLGPVEIESARGELARLARRQERCLLGVLLLEAGRMLPVDRWPTCFYYLTHNGQRIQDTNTTLGQLIGPHPHAAHFSLVE